MDDIQLCKDIMSLKQELRQIVTAPGTLQTYIYIFPAAAYQKINLSESIFTDSKIEFLAFSASVCSLPASHNLSRRHGWFIGRVMELNYGGLIVSLRDELETRGRDYHTPASSLWRQYELREAFQARCPPGASPGPGNIRGLAHSGDGRGATVEFSTATLPTRTYTMKAQ